MDGDEEMGDAEGAGDGENGKKRKVIQTSCFLVLTHYDYVLQRAAPKPASGAAKPASNKKTKAASGSKKVKELVEDVEDDD